MPPRYQAALRYACWLRHDRDAGLLRRQERQGDRPAGRRAARSSRCCRDEIIKALRVALETVLDEEAAKSEQFKKIPFAASLKRSVECLLVRVRCAPSVHPAYVPLAKLAQTSAQRSEALVRIALPPSRHVLTVERS